MKKSYEIDMCNGPLLGKILVFSIPLMLSGILQLLFNAADIIVVGRFAGSTALAAVGSTASLINLMINVFVGLSVGVNVLAARYYGAQKEKDIQDTVHTAIMMAILSGLFLVVLGESASKPMLTLMGTPRKLAQVFINSYSIIICIYPAFCLCLFAHSFDEQQTCKDHTYFNSHDQVK